MRTQLKGGSLSGTYMMSAEGGDAFVRKECRMDTNRVYGYQRWYSQLKRMQRYNHLFPGLFPNVLKYGADGGIAYYDMEVTKGISAFEFLKNEKDSKEIDYFFNQLIYRIKWMSSTQFLSNRGISELYFKEEVEQKVYDCQANLQFWNFLKYRDIYFNGEKIVALSYNIYKFAELFNNTYNETQENFSHGNLTLENILYDKESGLVTFIDPYEENVIDSTLADYSQIMQSCNSKYELYNLAEVTIDDNKINCHIEANFGLEYFNEKFREYVGEEKMPTVRLLEISQFVRMLPFKMNVDEKKMFLFYGLASKMVNDI